MCTAQYTVIQCVSTSKLKLCITYTTNTYSKKVKQSWSFTSCRPHSPAHPHAPVCLATDFIDITSDVLPCDATGEESLCMPQPSPTLICCDIITSSIHCLEQGPLVLSPMLIDPPPTCRKKLLDRIEEWGVR